MWISVGRGWLAVAALALGTAEAVNVNKQLNFTSGFTGDFPSTDSAIVKLGTANSRPFFWTASSDVIVEEITLWGFDVGKNPELVAWGRAAGVQGIVPEIEETSARQTSIATSSLPALPTPPLQNEPNPRRRDGAGTRGEAQLRLTATEQGGQVLVTSPLVFQSTSKLYYLKANWTSGASYSRLFGVVADDTVLPDEDMVKRLSDVNPYRGEVTVSSTATTGTSQPTSGVIDVAPNGSSSNKDDTTTKDSGGGLSSGAVIGIAVACAVIGLALIGVLVWFLLRRRKQKQAMLPDDSYGSDNRRGELMAEKEPSAEVDVSPHSPYSDAGASGANGSYHETAALTEGAAGAVAGAAAPHQQHQHQQDQSRSFTPYSDRPSGSGAAAAAAAAAGTSSVRSSSIAQNDEAHVSIPSATPGRATPRALTTPYAHLVEEGMTEEEIRRLEDEERQLDAAIEQAGRR